MPKIVNEDQAEFWEGMAPTWIDIEERIEGTASEPGLAAMEALAPQPGEKILDLGCGTGGTSITLARMVGPDGSVVGADISSEMLARARQRAQESETKNVQFVHADVQTEDFGESSFDAAFSRFGVMFYTDPVTAFGNIRTSLRPAARLSFVCWQQIFANEWMLVPGMAVMSVTGTPPPMPAPGEPGPFSLSDPKHVQSLLELAGYRDVDVAAYNDLVVLPQGEIARYAATSLLVGAAREALKEANDATRANARDAVEAALTEKISDGDVRLSRGYLVVTAST
ncbi:MAG TPA: class I SAM-dependent methyltransferase [Acidimicrobiales bacterium]|nr:class I SAM-dependent methyltransferase [Acidimicrobiales bacterium]